ncbi:ribonuclease III domain-containing protein [Glomus cerebriforme]|uniref:Ribonuclease III domain-containing protein n=1 Tax=Glomus cerebriforme TaxID=658196 RepID=A0A397SSF8_9GLOM|nr:ribonuclease III domain-containing protein [Glomus cerebriforme]
MFRITNISNISQKFIIKSQNQNFFSFSLSSLSPNLPKKLTLPPLKDETLRDEILTHPSSPINNHHPYRRYCFYGDKAYNYFIARELYNKLPNASNAELTILTCQLISRNFLAEVAVECGLDKLIKVAKNAPITTGILCENVEAHFAIYILNGMEEEMKKFAADIIDFYFEKEGRQKK